MRDDYRLVTAIFRGISHSRQSFFVEKPPTRGSGTVSIPRSLIHGGDDIKLDRWKVGDEFTFRLREWKAEALGLA